MTCIGTWLGFIWTWLRIDSGTSPLLLDGVRGCQYRMTSYDEESGDPDFTPAYGVQLHDPQLLEYVGAPESARLLSRSPEYWERPSPDYGSHILNSGARDNIFHITQYLSSNIRLLPSAFQHRLTTYRQHLSIVYIMDSGRRTNCTHRPRSRISPACSISSPAVSPAHQCACPTTFASKYRSVLDGSRTTSSDK